MQMNLKGAKVWERMTGNAFKTGGQIAIVLDDIVYSAPGVTRGAISGGRSEITGDFDLNEAIDLANVLRAGSLPALSTFAKSIASYAQEMSSGDPNLFIGVADFTNFLTSPKLLVISVSM